MKHLIIFTLTLIYSLSFTQDYESRFGVTVAKFYSVDDVYGADNQTTALYIPTIESNHEHEFLARLIDDELRDKLRSMRRYRLTTEQFLNTADNALRMRFWFDDDIFGADLGEIIVGALTDKPPRSMNFWYEISNEGTIIASHLIHINTRADSYEKVVDIMTGTMIGIIGAYTNNVVSPTIDKGKKRSFLGLPVDYAPGTDAFFMVTTADNLQTGNGTIAVIDPKQAILTKYEERGVMSFNKALVPVAKEQKEQLSKLIDSGEKLIAMQVPPLHLKRK